MALKIPKKGNLSSSNGLIFQLPAHPRLQGFEFGFIAHLHEAAWMENPGQKSTNFEAQSPGGLAKIYKSSRNLWKT